MKEIIFLDAGHSLTDPGAISPDKKEVESVHARKVRDLLAELLKKHFTVILVPDNLDLVETIKLINKAAKTLDSGYAFAIHVNSGTMLASGAETWYCAGNPGSATAEKANLLAKTIIDKYCEITGYLNRGAKPDTSARFHRLGFVRDTNCYAGLIELCFINNPAEIMKLKNNYQLIAEALYQGILAAYGIKEEKMIATKEDVVQIYKQILIRTDEEVLNDPEAMKYIGQPDTFIRSELMKSPERKERERDRANIAAAKDFINKL